MASLSKAVKNYQSALKRLFNTPDGYTVLATWKADFIDPTALCQGDPYSTMYALGQKELVQEFINHLKDDGVLDDVKLEIEE
jgi:hypothetical protein